jgi:RNA recognition motif-containing protein
VYWSRDQIKLRFVEVLVHAVPVPTGMSHIKEGVFPMAVKLFVGGLSFSSSSDRLRETFARFGSVESASVVTDRYTGRSRGFGFVEMALSEEANAAVAQLNGTELDGRRIKVELAKPSNSSAASPGQRRSGAAGWLGSRR